ncbi:MAG: sortase [Anaerolineae bacterium]
MTKGGETEVVRWEIADYAVGWHKNSAYSGNGGNIVLSGHHNIKGEVFRYLLNLSQSDKVILYVGKKPYHYRVAQKVLLRERGMPLEVRRQNAEWIAPTDHERLTMVTCWPYSSNTHRLIVVAFPAP